jgi:hypothetical protein
MAMLAPSAAPPVVTGMATGKLSGDRVTATYTGNDVVRSSREEAEKIWVRRDGYMSHRRRHAWKQRQQELKLTEEMEARKGGGPPVIHEEMVGRGTRKGASPWHEWRRATLRVGGP